MSQKTKGQRLAFIASHMATQLTIDEYMETFNIPEKMCPKCGKVIPLNGYELDKKGNAKITDGKLTYHRAPKLICEPCAIAVCPPTPKPPRLRKGEVSELQTFFEDVPSILIT